MHTHTRRSRVNAILSAALGIALVAAGLSGCYSRVVGVQGPGSDGVTVYEPNLKEPVESPYTDPEGIPTKQYKGK